MASYADAFRNEVAEETYQQSVRAWGQEQQFRRTRAEIVFVHLAAPHFWGVFRDVLEVDGRPVHDHRARLEKLFAQNADDALRQAQVVCEESARFNIGLPRTLNDPTVPLMFLHPANQARSRFKWNGDREIDGQQVVEIAFRERARPTLIRENGVDLPCAGRVWVAASDGAIVRAEITF